MRALFTAMLAISLASVLYQLSAGLHVMAHNHYDYRHDLLDPNSQITLRLNPNMGLSLADLSKCDEHVAWAYRNSVDDGYKLGSGYSSLNLQCIVLAALLFVTSIAGIRSLGRVPKSIQPTAGGN